MKLRLLTLLISAARRLLVVAGFAYRGTDNLVGRLQLAAARENLRTLKVRQRARSRFD